MAARVAVIDKMARNSADSAPPGIAHAAFNANMRILLRRVAFCSLIAALAWEVFFVDSFFGFVLVLAATYLYMGLHEWLTPTPAAKRRERWGIVPLRIVVVWGAVKITLELLR